MAALSARSRGAVIARGVLVLALALGGVGSAASARAHPTLDQVEAIYARAQVAEARTLLDLALTSGELTRDDFLRWLRLDALVHLASGEAASAERAITWLAALEPEADLGDAFPPEIVEAFARAAREGGLVLRARREAQPGGGTELVVEARGAPAGLVREIEGAAHATGVDPQPLGRGRATLDAAPSAVVGVWARALGPGGIVLATLGEGGDPHLLPPPASAVADAAAGGSAVDLEPSDDEAVHIGIAVGAAALVVIVVVIALAAWAASEASANALGPPMWERP